MRSRGLKDDTTCLVVDITPLDYPAFPPPTKNNQNKLSTWFLGKKLRNSLNKSKNKLSAVGAVEELFEEGSAMLDERLVSLNSYHILHLYLSIHLYIIRPIWHFRLCNKNTPVNANSGLSRCAVCQTDDSINSDPSSTQSSEGPYLCTICRKKKDAMEGKRHQNPK